MFPYIICAICSCFFTFLATHLKKTNGYTFWKALFSAIAIFLPCFLAAVRDSSVGTDVTVYGNSLFSSAQNSELSYFLTSRNVEPLFGILVFVLAKLSNIYIYYFVIQLFVILPVYVVLCRKETEKYAWFGVLLYFFWLYGYSLNLMRQCIAVAIVLWGSKYIFNRKLVKYIITAIIATGFHYSAIISLILYPLAVLTLYGDDISNKFFNMLAKKYHKVFKTVVALMALIVMYYTASIIETISNLMGKYQDQLKRITGQITIDYIYLLLIGMIFLIMCYLSRREMKDSKVQYCLYVIFLGMVLYQMKAISSQMYRVSLYYTSYMIFFIPQMLQRYKAKQIRQFSVAVIVMIFVVYIYWYYVIRSWNGVYPYVSHFLGIY